MLATKSNSYTFQKSGIWYFFFITDAYYDSEITKRSRKRSRFMHQIRVTDAVARSNVCFGNGSDIRPEIWPKPATRRYLKPQSSGPSERTFNANA